MTGTKAFALTTNAPLSIATSPSLPAAAAGSYYSQALAASGGRPRIRIGRRSADRCCRARLNAGSRCAERHASGVRRPFAFTVQVSDGSGLSVTLAMSLLVNAGAVVDAAPIPVLGPLALLLLSAVLGVAGIAATRRRRT